MCSSPKCLEGIIDNKDLYMIECWPKDIVIPEQMNTIWCK